MNANKLADAIEKSSHCGYNLDAAAMIRQQQSEIEALKILVDELAGYKASYENGIRMENGYGLN
jgi:hypothetical protein